MLLAIDIGNTNITLGIFKGKKLIFQADIPVKSYSKEKLIRKLKLKQSPDVILICSVVAGLTKKLSRDLKQTTGKKPLIIGKDLILPVQNLYRKKSELGMDRLLNAYAAGKLYSGNLIIIDAGTAITIDAVSREGEFLGGTIFPGMNMLLKSLKENTSLLPKINLREPKELIGKDTKSCILSGVVYGTALVCKGLSELLKEKLGNAKMIGTGGNIGLIKKYSGLKIKIEEQLALKGLNLLYEKKK